MNAPLIAGGRLHQSSLEGEVAIVTGAGGGIGLEAARSLLWLGASVVIAEIDAAAGRHATEILSAESDPARVFFVPADVGEEPAVAELVDAVVERFGKVDVVLNNAAYAAVGQAVADTAIEEWDRSYAANLRGPVLLARAFLPGMIERGHGVFVCVSSTGGPYLGAYEALKAAQLAVANTLDAELDGTGVIAFTIGPGLIPTETAKAAIEAIAPKLGTTVEEFWRTNAGAVLSVEAAGAGFAAAVALASRYAGQEISSTQALIDAGISVPDAFAPAAPPDTVPVPAALEACRAVQATLLEQAAGWKRRSFFERQWMLRDFKQRAGVPVERCLELLERSAAELAAGNAGTLLQARPTLERLAAFYAHMAQLAEGYIKDPAQRAEQVRLVQSWEAEVRRLLTNLG